jgi:exodeoxyribonuclease I
MYMADSFFFYDLETSGLGASAARIMQFAGQRTDADLNPIGEPVNVLLKLAPDVLPEPDAILITGITPQSTVADGLTEAEFLKFFYEEVVQPNTTFLGFNTVRFDDEFMRFLHYRNFYDPYEWHWANGCSRWDVLDLVRMTRALRPDGIEWPVDAEGKPTNRLELLTKANGLDHEHAHDALNDVLATIAVAKLIREKQPELFNYLYTHRSKKAVAEVVGSGQPFVYTSGRYGSPFLHTTAVTVLAPHTQADAAVVYDLRYDPTPFLTMTPEQLADAWRYKKDREPNDPRLPVKTLKYNRCPAIAPLGVMKDAAAQKNIGLTLETVTRNLEILKQYHIEFATKVMQTISALDAERKQAYEQADEPSVDARLYDEFFASADKQAMSLVRAASPDELTNLSSNMPSKRLQQLLPLYKARNFPAALTDDERQVWDTHIAENLLGGGEQSRAARYFGRLQELSARQSLTTEQRYLLEELQLYGESILPSDLD